MVTWIDKYPWRWRLAHLLIAAGLEWLHVGLGVWTYLIHEGTQYLGPGRKPVKEHALDLTPSVVCFGLRIITLWWG